MSLSAYAGETGKVQGRVMYKDQPLPGALVYAYYSPEGLFRKDPAVPAAVSDSDGGFTLKLPKGQYYIAALKKKDSKEGPPEAGDFYSFYGGNPITADPARPARAVLSMFLKPSPQGDVPSKDDRGGVSGVVTFDGQPLDGVVVFVYLDPNDAFRGLGYYMTPPTGVDGSFKMKMSEGTYYLIARKRMNHELAGPLREGDYFGYLDTNPLVVRKGAVMQVEIPLVKKIEKSSPGGHGRTVVSGLIKDKDGKALPGMYACLYKNSEMINRPIFVSKPTGPDGRFEIELPVGGSYYLGARSVIGSQMEPGQLWGRYSGTPNHQVTVDTGRALDGLDIKAEKVEE